MLKNVRYAYDINLNDNNKVFNKKYNLELSEDRKYYYVFVDESYMPENLENDLVQLRINKYRSLKEFGLADYLIDCDNVIGNYIIALKGKKIKPLEFVYHPEVINNRSFLFGSVVYVDLITGKIYAIRTRNFGIENNEKINFLENNGYKHITNSLLINHLDKVNKSIALELKKK